MINSNAIIIEFFGQNWLGIMLAVNLLKGIAILTPSNKDDSVVKLFSDTFDVIKDVGDTINANINAALKKDCK